MMPTVGRDPHRGVRYTKSNLGVRDLFVTNYCRAAQGLFRRAHASAEACCEAVLHGFARGDLTPIDLMVLGPGQELVVDEVQRLSGVGPYLSDRMYSRA